MNDAVVHPLGDAADVTAHPLQTYEITAAAVAACVADTRQRRIGVVQPPPVFFGSGLRRQQRVAQAVAVTAYVDAAVDMVVVRTVTVTATAEADAVVDAKVIRTITATARATASVRFAVIRTLTVVAPVEASVALDLRPFGRWAEEELVFDLV